MEAMQITRRAKELADGSRLITLQRETGERAVINDEITVRGHLVYGDFFSATGANITAGQVYAAGYTEVASADEAAAVAWREAAARDWLAKR